MRIVVHGQQAFGKAVLDRLLERGEEVAAVCCAPQKAGRPVDPLAEAAADNGLPVHQPGSWKTPEALELMKGFEADICLMAYVLLFVPQAVLDAPRIGTFQYHPSLCPHHRGPSSINWPIAMGRSMTGLTIFWPNDRLDEGPILMQKTCPIGPDETLGDVYFKKLFPMGVDAMMESLDLVKAGVVIRHDQRLDDGSYESWFGREQARLDWSKPVVETYNIIRAANPAPGAWTTHDGKRIQIFDSSRTEGIGPAGEIADVSVDGVTVQGNGGRIVMKRVRPDGQGKIPAIEWARSEGIAPGARLGT
ncbi:MAG: methionyl-tRNA formyltransferase [Rhodobacteraceae bacterium]|nr:methionyl-tRNA formyltransferase [Paracoccaceae bacterium]MCY4138737.1 methionyl-tRNA formyltransferase [Paracoccaceae bacterium]